MDKQELVSQVIGILEDFRTAEEVPLRERVLKLAPAFDGLRSLGKLIIPDTYRLGASERSSKYFTLNPFIFIQEKELIVISGISEWGRRVRELRVQDGWKIVTGQTAKSMVAIGDLVLDGLRLSSVKKNDYILLDEVCDLELARRWYQANKTRKLKGSDKDRVLAYLRQNLGRPVTGEELAYVAKTQAWARRIRELRTEEGWKIVTKFSGDPTLPMGSYKLVTEDRGEVHDRKIPDAVRKAVLARDKKTCRDCGWNEKLWTEDDPRFLELHHVDYHVDGGENTEENLRTICNVCHDKVHSNSGLA